MVTRSGHLLWDVEGLVHIASGSFAPFSENVEVLMGRALEDGVLLTAQCGVVSFVDTLVPTIWLRP